MSPRSVRDNLVQTLAPVAVVLLPVGTVMLTDPSAFRRIFGMELIHTLSEIYCMFLAVALGGFMLLRHAGGRRGLHFWFAGGLLGQGVLLGYHAIDLVEGLSTVFQMLALVVGAVFAGIAVLRPGRRCGWLGRAVPLLVVVTTTASGWLISTQAPTVEALVEHPSAGTVTLWTLRGAAVLFGLFALRAMLGFGRTRVSSLLWLGVFALLHATACLLGDLGMGQDVAWLFTLLRVSAFTVLMAYAATVSTADVGLLGRTEEDLRRSEARFKALTENTADIVFILDPAGRFSYVSPAAARVAGVREEDLIGQPPGGYTHHEDRERVAEGLRKARKRPGDTISIGTIRVRHTDGRWLHVEGVYTCLEHDLSVHGTVLNYRDVTERHESQLALEESRNQLDRLISSLPGMVYRSRIGDDLVVEYVSEYCLELTGHPPEAFIERRIKAGDIVHPDDFEDMRTIVWEAAHENRPFQTEYRIVALDGSVKWIMERGVAVRGDDGDLEFVEGIMIEITDLVESRRELRRTKFSVENATDTMFWVDRTGRLVNVNETACRQLGYSRDEMLAMTLFDVSTDLKESDWPDAWDMVKRQGSVLLEGEHVTKTGRRFPVEVSSIFLDFEGEEFHCCFVRDITDRKEAERRIQIMNAELEQRVKDRTAALEEAQAQLVTSEKMAALGNLVAGVAHEINTPLGIGVTAASHLEKKVQETVGLYEEQSMKKTDFESFLDLSRETSALILTNLRRAADLVQGFKQVSVDQSSERRREFDVAEYVDEIVRSLKPEYGPYGHVVETACTPGLTMDSYPGAFAQVITNLIVNSVKHGFDNREGGSVWLSIDGDGDHVRILYKDDGCGMSAEQVRKLYDPFFTTKRGRGGSGLGMNIVYNLVTQVLKGSIECQSAVGQGTVFMVDLPRIAPLDTEIPATAPDEEPATV